MLVGDLHEQVSRVDLIYKDQCLFVLYRFGYRTRQCSQIWQEVFSHLGEGRGLRFTRKLKSSPVKDSLCLQLLELQYSLVKKNY